MKLGRFVKTTLERKRYVIDYNNWLDTGELISSRAFTVTPTSPSSSLFINGDANNVDNRSMYFFVNEGAVGVDYTLTIRITTSGGQVKEDTIIFSVKDQS